MTTSGTTRFRSPALRRLARVGRAEGKAEGKAESVPTVLAARSIALPDDVRERNSTCDDLALLDRWLTRAATATTVEELFA